MSSNQVIRKPLQFRLTGRERQSILLIGDLLTSGFSLFLALYFWAQPDWLQLSLEFIQERIPFWFYFLPLLWLVLLVELYDLQRAAKFSLVIRGVFAASLVCLGLYLLVYFTSEPNSLPRRGVAVFIFSAFFLTLIWRFLYIKIFTAPPFMRRVLVVGAGRSGRLLAEIVSEIWPPPFYLVGFIDDDQSKADQVINGYKILGSSADLLNLVEKLSISDLIFSISKDTHPGTFQNLLKAQEFGVQIKSMPAVYEEVKGRVPIKVLQSDWLLRSFVDQATTSSFYKLGKRLMDILGGLLGMIILLLILPVVGLAILLDSGRPVLYSQNRLGKSGKVFKIYKFRTMYQDAEKDGKPKAAQENDERITRIGRILRKSHLDEFPQFINVLRGDMSLVGPRAERPELAEELHAAIPFYRARLLVKPGLTGWAQVNFGYASTVEASAVKLEYDLYYIKNQNLLLDFSIILRTVGTVFGFQGR